MTRVGGPGRLNKVAMHLARSSSPRERERGARALAFITSHADAPGVKATLLAEGALPTLLRMLIPPEDPEDPEPMDTDEDEDEDEDEEDEDEEDESGFFEREATPPKPRTTNEVRRSAELFAAAALLNLSTLPRRANRVGETRAVHPTQGERVRVRGPTPPRHRRGRRHRRRSSRRMHLQRRETSRQPHQVLQTRTPRQGARARAAQRKTTLARGTSHDGGGARRGRILRARRRHENIVREDDPSSHQNSRRRRRRRLRRKSRRRRGRAPRRRYRRRRRRHRADDRA